MTLSLAKRMSHEKDQELSTVHNRIKVLMNEERRTLKKIEETRRKANHLNLIH